MALIHRNTSALRHRRKRGAGQTGLVDGQQGGVDQLSAADFAHSEFGHGAGGGGRRQAAQVFDGAC